MFDGVGAADAGGRGHPLRSTNSSRRLHGLTSRAGDAVATCTRVVGRQRRKRRSQHIPYTVLPFSRNSARSTLFASTAFRAGSVPTNGVPNNGVRFGAARSGQSDPLLKNMTGTV